MPSHAPARGRVEARRALTHAQAAAFYDRFAWLQDWQRWYESPATEVLLREGAFGDAHAVLELGCGTGRLAERLLARELPADARYLGLDVSARMVARTRRRLARFTTRSSVRQTDGSLRFPGETGTFDRVVAAYVLELLSDEDSELALEQAHRVLAPGGLLCVASLGEGVTRASRALCRAWSAVHRVHPVLVGGCRPVRLQGRLAPSSWEILHAETVVAFAVPTEVVVARSRDGGGGASR
ncbi:MAG TPA: class I SAM-dependent methyltransferase [Anaeromyxobacter sp.]